MSERPENCTHNCSTCGHASADGTCGGKPIDMMFPSNKNSRIKKIIGIVSGKGGVGKSLVTGLSSVAAMRDGKSVGILDADVTGPSIPKMFGLTEQLHATEDSLLPAETNNKIKVVSTNLVLEHPDDPVVWRGPVITSLLRQFYSDVAWGDLDVLFCDMPPGTGDVPLTVFQSFPLDGIIIVTSPQSLVSQIVTKALKMANLMSVPIVGLVENFSYITCPNCDEKIDVFGKSHLDDIALKYNLPIIDRLPIDSNLANACDQGEIESYRSPGLDSFSKKLMDSLF